jgi:hypothetical protein
MLFNNADEIDGVEDEKNRTEHRTLRDAARESECRRSRGCVHMHVVNTINKCT